MMIIYSVISADSVIVRIVTQLVHRVSDAFLLLLVAQPSSQRVSAVVDRLSLEGSTPQTERFADCCSSYPSHKCDAELT